MSVELITLLTLIGGFLVLAAVFKLPAAFATAGSAILGLLVSGNVKVPYHLVEGAFGYFDAILIIAVAMVFMKALEDSGILEEIAQRMYVSFGDKPVPLTFISMFLVMLPGMLTGSSTAAALTTGKFVIPVLISAGIPKIRAAGLVAVGSVLGMVAPPVNIPAMIIGAGVDMPYIGIDMPLLMLTIPLAIFISIWAVAKCEKSQPVSEPTGYHQDRTDDKDRISGFVVYIPIIAVLALMIIFRIFSGVITDPGIPLIFVAGTVLTVLCGNKFNMWKALVDGIKRALPTMGVLVGAGMFVQVMTLSGVRGLLVVSALDLPTQYIFITAIIIVPLFGAISAFASSSVMGVPIVLALLGHGEIVTASAITVMASLGDLIPPIALVPTIVTESLEQGPEFRKQLLRECIFPGLVVLLWSFLFLWQAPIVSSLLGLS